jgi:hypothetical protein
MELEAKAESFSGVGREGWEEGGGSSVSMRVIEPCGWEDLRTRAGNSLGRDITENMYRQPEQDSSP